MSSKSEERGALTPSGRYRHSITLAERDDARPQCSLIREHDPAQCQEVIEPIPPCPICGRPWSTTHPGEPCPTCQADEDDAEAERGLR
jgi:rubrerythrin